MTKEVDKEKGWIHLFNGSSTEGWHTYNKPAISKLWKVDDGTLYFDAALKKEMPEEAGDIITNEEFEDFHLKLEWKISPKGNSGIIFLVHEAPEFQYPWHTGLEMQLLDNGTPIEPGHADAKFYTHRAGDLYDLIAAEEAVNSAGEWNATEIVVNQGKLDFMMNGEHTLSVNLWNDNWWKMVALSKFKDKPGFARYRKGKIALQDHGDNVWFRNIQIKRL
jgi:hypothetical protein